MPSSVTKLRRPKGSTVGFKPMVEDKEAVGVQVIRIANNEESIRKLNLSRLIVQDVIKGNNYAYIAAKHGITPQEAAKLARETISKWASELQMDANQARELDLQRYDRLLAQLDPLIHPEPYIDEKTGALVTPKPDANAMRLYIDILDKRAAIFGYNSKEKLEQQRNEVLNRIYVGVAANKKGEIDL